jgi:hypothetical protein
MVSVFALSVVDGEFHPCLVNPQTITLVLPVAHRSKSKSWLTLNTDDMSE